MADATGRPQRMRYSFEARCRAVALMRAGVSPGVAAATVGASRATGYRWRARNLAEGWPGLRERPSTPKRQPRRLSAADEATILAAREHSGAGPLMLGALLGRPASTFGKVRRRLGRSRRPRLLRPPVRRYERVHPGRATTPGHQEAGSLLAHRQAHPPRRHPAQSTSRLAARACGGGRPFTVGVRRGAAQ